LVLIAELNPTGSVSKVNELAFVAIPRPTEATISKLDESRPEPSFPVIALSDCHAVAA
jgi:hypothetical protein